MCLVSECMSRSAREMPDVRRKALFVTRRAGVAQSHRVARWGGRASSSRREEALGALNDVVTILRKNDLVALRGVVEPRGEGVGEGVDSSSVVLPGGIPGSGLLQRCGYRDGGVLVDFADVFDLTSRRLLPSNLLRRSRVLSVMRRPQAERRHGDASGYLVRMSVTAKSGEEGTVLWELSGTNRLVSCVESREEGGETCTTVHPRHSPDAVLAGYMHSMQEKNFLASQEFCAWNCSLYDGLDLSSFESRFDPAYRRALADFFSCTSMSVPYYTIPHSEEWLLADGVLVDQRRMVREVVVRVGSGEWLHWGVELAIGRNGCWMIEGINVLE